MRCKPKDVVQVLKSTCGNEGRVGQVERWVEAYTLLTPEFMCPFSGWVVIGTFNAKNLLGNHVKEFPFSVFPDEWLRPLRDSDGVDEVLRYAGHPLSQSHRERQVEHSR
jgi:hypothetical protein